MALSDKYEEAIKVHNRACRIYSGKLAEYRAMTIGDEEFLEARAAMKAADAVFDVAFDEEANKPEEHVGVVVDEKLDLFTKS